MFKMFCERNLLRNVGNLIIFREKFLDLRPKSFCAVEMTMYNNNEKMAVKEKDPYFNII